MPRCPRTIAGAVLSAALLGGCIPFAWDADPVEVIVQNQTDEPMTGVLQPSARGFDIEAADARGPGLGRLSLGTGECGLTTLELYRGVEGDPVATVDMTEGCDLSVIYEGPDHVTILEGN